jgi:hypothetical protein
VTVGRSHIFSLDDAALSGGAAIVAAGSGLPRRITGAIDYEARVLALGPSGYWPLNETTGQFLDRSAAARHLTHSAGTIQRAQLGCGIGGSLTAALASSNAYNVVISADAVYDEHKILPSVGFAMCAWVRNPTTGGGYQGIVGTNSWSAGSHGWQWLAWYGSAPYLAVQTIRVRASSGEQYARDSVGGRASRVFRSEWTFVAVRHSGGVTRFLTDGVWEPGTSGPLVDPAAAVAALRVVNGSLTSDVQRHWHHLALWGGAVAVPSEAQLLALATAIPCGRAPWTLPVDVTQPRTLKGFAVPGSLSRSVNTTESRLGVRCYYSIAGAAEVEFDPGDDLSVSIPTGATCTLAADLTHHHLDDLPWIGDSLGGGPVALYEEADPAHPANATAVRSTFGAIEIDFDHGIESTVQPTNDPLPALQLGAASIVDGTTLRLEHEGMLTVAEPLAVTVEDLSALRVTVQDLDQLRVTVED